MIKEEIKVYEDINNLCVGFTDFLKKLLEVYPRINLSLSGGNTPKALFEFWSKNCQESIDWERITLFWGDERCVPPEDSMSNFGMTKEYLIDKVPAITGQNTRRVHGENEPNEEAEWYNKALRRKLPLREDIPCFEIVMLGLGDDGHTVSIFPDQIDLWDSEKDCIVAEHPETKMKRISITGRVVNNAQYVVFLVTGKNKAQKVKEIIESRKQFSNQYPAARVNPKYGYLYWFMDQEAASLL